MSRYGVETIFAELVNLDPAERTAKLSELCGTDAELRVEVESLLAAAAQAEGFLSVPPVTPLLDAGPRVQPGHRIGAYQLIRELGQGGMGAVFLAERADGEYQQQVAIKLCKPGIAGSTVLDRFQAERQILADLEHANIARLLDGGTDDQGQPYLVME